MHRNLLSPFWRWFFPFILVTGGLLAVNLIWLIPTIRNIRASASLLLLEIAERARGQITFDLETALKALENSAEEISAEPERSEIILKRLLKRKVNFDNVALADRTGKETVRISRIGPVPKEELRSHAKAPHFHLALEGAPNSGGIFISPESQPFTALAIPVYRGKTIVNILISDLNLRSLSVAAHAVQIGTGHIYIVDREGFLIGHPNVAEILRRPNFIHREIVQRVIIDGQTADGLSPKDSYLNEAGERIFAVGVPIPFINAGLLVELPRNEALAYERQAIAFAAITIILGLLLFVVFVRDNLRLTELNRLLEERNQESLVSAKMLVRRDRELVLSNLYLRDLVAEADRTAKLLVRRDLELSEVNTRLHELDVVKSEFVSIAAHQLRTPLTGIRWSFLALLEETRRLDPEHRKIAEGGLRTTIKAIEMIGDLLDVARIEEGRFGFSFHRQELIPVITKVSQKFTEEMAKKGIKFKLITPKTGLPSLDLDEEKISMALENLLDNAVKYTPPGGAVTLNILKEKHRVMIEIKDTGIGIPEKQQHRVFSKFFRGDNAVLIQTAGIGLGLYTVKNIVENHGGEIFFESKPDKGSTFTFTLPIPEEERSLNAERSTAKI